MPEQSIVGRLAALPAGWAERNFCWSDTGRLSFAQVGERTPVVAAWLTAAEGVRAHERVAVCLPKSIEALQILLGVLATGAAIVPLQFRGPPTRLREILASVRPCLLLTTGQMATQLALERHASPLPPIREIEVLADGSGLDRLLASAPSSFASVDVEGDDLAAIIFTSGSTGEPKGVMLSHRYIAETAAWVRKRGDLGEGDRLISHAGLHYITAIDQFLPLYSGCPIFLLPERDAMFPQRVVEVLAREGITIWSSSVTTLRLLHEQGGLELKPLPALRRVEFHGEPISPGVLAHLMAALPEAEFVNIYGATEAYDMANFRLPRPLSPEMDGVPAGRPSGDYKLVLVDELGAEVPQGATGEICVTRGPVFQGYWDDPSLSLEKRLAGRTDSYRTGDLGKIGLDGLLRLAGRKDDAVKLHGHRFELGEIAAALKRHPAVRDAVVFVALGAQGDSEVRAAVLAAESGNLVALLRRFCRDRLPAYAQPSHIEVLESFPTLSSGKVDRQALARVLSSPNADS